MDWRIKSIETKAYQLLTNHLRLKEKVDKLEKRFDEFEKKYKKDS